ncbi:MAG: copper resistance protein NlpE N-terminal domain-containing protein [Muribaculaceae bacterium]|nr:copper resistance protein NlpE N-terminal domain-containing protein [Muribaculaceae bacterium]
MKRILSIFVAGATLAMAGGCSGQSQQNAEKNPADTNDSTALYSGVLPGADTGGILYRLRLAYDKTDEYTSGTYNLSVTYDASGSASDRPTADSLSSDTEGAFVVEEGAGENAGKRYIRLMADKNGDKSNATSVGKQDAASSLYFMIDSDSTISMVGSDLQPAPSGLDYSLRLVK